MLYEIVRNFFFNGKSQYTVYIILCTVYNILHRMRVENRVFYTTISKRSCHLKHCTCFQILAIHRKLDIRSIYSSFKLLFLTINLIVSKCILHEKSEYSVRIYCTECSLKYGCFIRRYRSDPAI